MTTPSAARTDTAPENLDIGGELEPFFRGILAARFPDITDFGPAVPDPSLLAIFGLGLLALGFLRRLTP